MVVFSRTSALLIFSAVISQSLLCGAPPTPPPQSSWDYNDVTVWPVTCTSGQSQSPVDIVTANVVNSGSSTLTYFFSDKPTRTTILFDHSTLRVKLTMGTPPKITFGEEEYVFLRYDLHVPSEHSIDAGSGEAEVQIMFESAAGKKAIISFIFEAEQQASEGVRDIQILKDMLTLINTKIVGQKVVDCATVGKNCFDFAEFFNKTPLRFTKYSGSITQPPCDEDVTWFVAMDFVKVPFHQVAALAGLETEYGNNARTQQTRSNLNMIEVFAESASFSNLRFANAFYVFAAAVLLGAVIG